MCPLHIYVFILHHFLCPLFKTFYVPCSKNEMILFKKYIEAKELILKKVEEGIYFALFSLTFLGRQSYFSFFFFYEVK